MTIYYCYEKKSGRFAGSGIYLTDNEEIGYTTIACPSYNNTTHVPYWTNNNWIIKEK